MRTISSKLSVLALVFGVSMSWGCSSDNSQPTDSNIDTSQGALTDVTGHVLNIGENLTAIGFAGAGTIEATKKVIFSELGDGGELKKLTETTINNLGAFTAKVPLNAQPIIVQAVDAAGDVLGSSILDAKNVANNAVIAAPITAESSLEAEVLMKLASDLAADVAAKVLASPELTTLIDADLANAVGVAAKTGINPAALIEFVASATLSAQKAQLQSLAGAGVNITEDVLAGIDTDASQKLNAALSAGGAVEKAVAQFQADIMDALKAKGISPEIVAQAQTAASTVFQAMLVSEIAAAAIKDVDAVVFAAVHSAAKAEALATAQALTAITTASGATQETVDAIGDLATKFTDDVAAAKDMAAITKAKDELVAALTGDTSVLGSVASLLGVDGALKETLQAVGDAAAKLSGTLETDLTQALNDYVKVAAGGHATEAADAALKKVIEAFSTFNAGVEKLAADLVADGASVAEAAIATDVFGLAQSTLHALSLP